VCHGVSGLSDISTWGKTRLNVTFFHRFFISYCLSFSVLSVKIDESLHWSQADSPVPVKRSSLPHGKPFKSVTRGQCDARPTVTFPAVGHNCPVIGTKLYWLVTEARVCVNNLPKVVIRQRNGRKSNSRPFGSQLQCPNYYTTGPRKYNQI